MVMEENPIISIDTKKKEVLGPLTRDEAVLAKGAEPIPVYDHDYPHLGSGKAIPHGTMMFNWTKDTWVSETVTRTAEFVVDNLHSGGGKVLANMNIPKPPEF